MYIHNIDPVLFNFGFIEIRWYSLAYIFGIIIGWWLGRQIISKKFNDYFPNFKIEQFDDLITYIIISIILGGRIGYVLFYNLEYYVLNPFDILKLWEGGMSFHGALIGIILGTYLFSKKRKLSTFFLLDVIACVSPIGIFFGRITNFINGELIGKKSDIFWSVVFPKIDNFTRHPSQIYEALLEGLLLFIIMNYILFQKNYRIGNCSFMFLITYGCLRIISEFFREPDTQVGYLFGIVSMGTFLSALMILAGSIILFIKNDKK